MDHALKFMSNIKAGKSEMKVFDHFAFWKKELPFILRGRDGFNCTKKKLMENKENEFLLKESSRSKEKTSLIPVSKKKGLPTFKKGYCIMMPLIPYNLDSLFNDLKNKNNRLSCEDQILTEKWFLQTVAGVSFMHDHGVLHHDLKEENVMIDNNYNVLITDFGLANIINDKERPEIIGTPPYICPELYENGKSSYPCDVYALGVMMWRICKPNSGSLYPEVSNELQKYVSSREHLMKPDKNDDYSNCKDWAPKKIGKLIMGMIDHDESKRIKLKDVLQQFGTNRNIVACEAGFDYCFSRRDKKLIDNRCETFIDKVKGKLNRLFNKGKKPYKRLR
eukprot:GHVR01179627.1.p1 GENE.GHVR01179627.1~~GHVR01179627.1.p1  ORF type:complete len:369 (-),score=47.66 GHVR01179627.1:356-1360(-)